MFETIYSWFSSLYHSNLAEHLIGWDETVGDYIKSNLFNITGFITVGIVVAACVIYYYALNHPRQNRWFKWMFLWLLPVAVINFIIAFGLSLYDVIAENISSDLMPISWIDCLGFGIANFIISALLFLLVSLLIKWGSRNCKYSPFVKF